MPSAAADTEADANQLNRTSSRRWTSSSFRCALQTASRTTTSSISAIWSRRRKPRCFARRTSAEEPQ
jgi:hypothetical protein